MIPTEAKSRLSHYRDKPFRDYQEDAVKFILDSEKRFVFLEAPTGSGKSLIAMVAGIAMGGVTYSVHSKVLQTQITQDFPEARSLFGRSNYPCIANDSLSCDECFFTTQTPCSQKGRCKYEVEKKAVLNSQLRILNYDYLLTEINYVGRFSGSPFNIIDEGDNLEATLINFTTLTFTAYALGRLGLASFADSLKKTSKNTEELLNSWKSFAVTAKIRAQSIIGKLSSTIDSFGTDISPDQAKVIKERTRVNRLREKITLFLDNVDPTWVLDDSQQDKYIFRPLWLTPELAEAFIWRHATRWVLMSASFLPIHLEAKRLGIPLDEIDYKLLPSTFPVSRRPIHIDPVANLTGKTMDAEVPKLVSRIKEIVTTHPTSKGLIHGVSYKLSQAIINGVDSPRLLIHNSTNRQETLSLFMESEQPYVLVSPSMERGISLEMDLCRFIIVAKAPFAYLGDKIVSARVYGSQLGREWYSATMLLTVLQATGRGMRSADDFCESYILDAQFKRVYEQKPMFLPMWWRESVSW
jgi:ATP-dependent DNA helicase DinG